MSGTQVRIGESCPEHGGFYYDWVDIKADPPRFVRGPSCCGDPEGSECWPVDIGHVTHPDTPVGRAHLAALAARSSH